MSTALLPQRPPPDASAPGPAALAPQARRGRGRPPALTDPERIEQLLSDIRSGSTVAEAAAAAGLSRTPVYHLRGTDQRFAQALTHAQEAGKKARRATGPRRLIDQHGTESSYTKRQCTCERCRVAGSRARARRRAAARQPNAPAATAA